jgi:F-type H+-transporting ATPase subunit b
MLIDWFTLIAQLINFLILAWLLKRFLYHPIVKALDAREKKIASELQHAAMVEEEAKKSMAEWKQKNDEFEKNRMTIMQQAVKEADDKKAELFIEAHKEYENLRARLDESLHNEQKNLQQEIIDRISNEVFSMAEKVLAELADVTLEDRIVKVFCERLQKTEEVDIKEMTGLFRQSNHPPIIRSVFTLTPENCERVKKTVMEVFSIDTNIVFETDAGLISGLELSMNGHSIKWNIKAYLDGLKVTVEADLERDKKTSEHGNETRDAQNHP